MAIGEIKFNETKNIKTSNKTEFKSKVTLGENETNLSGEPT